MADTDARRRMAVLATTTALYIFVESGFMVVGPLWATRDLGMDNAGWAFLRSASELGGLISVLFLGILAERLGPRRTSAIALFGGGLLLAAISTGRATAGLIAFYGAFVSITYVSFNTLAQRVSTRRQSLANAIYRAAGAAAAIAAPVVGTQAAHMTGSYAPVIRAAALILGLAGLAILFYPEPPGSHRPRSFSESLSGFARCFRMPPLLAFIALTRTFGIAIAAVGAFAALRFTRELHMSIFQSGTTMLVMLVLGLLEPRVGMQTLMAAGGVLGLAMAIAIVRLGRAQGV
jgi:MFS family permease